MAKILIVDDEPANRALLTTLLLYAGHDVVQAGDGHEALQKAKADCPDLIVVDLNLPGMHGTQFVKALRTDPDTASVKIALYTATAPNESLTAFMEVTGIRHLVPKPSEPSEALEAIAAALT